MEKGWRTLTGALDNSRKVKQLNPGPFIFENAWYCLPLVYQSRECRLGLAGTDRKRREFVRGSLGCCVRAFVQEGTLN